MLFVEFAGSASRRPTLVEYGRHAPHDRPDDEKAPDEFADRAAYHATSPDSHFAGDFLATRATEDGRFTLSGEKLTVTVQGTRRKQAVSKERLDAVLRDRFGLPGDDRDGWREA